MTQILFIHGGNTFETYEDYLSDLRNSNISLDSYVSWSHDYFKESLPDFQVIKPKLPCKENAKYNEWKIVFEKYLELLNQKIILVGYSLGGIFLAKYLSENKISKKLISVYLIAPPFDNSLKTEDLAGGFELSSDLSLIESQCKKIVLMFSSSDSIVPLEHAELYRKKLLNSKIIIYNHIPDHFFVEEFPEIIEMIKSDVNL